MLQVLYILWFCAFGCSVLFDLMIDASCVLITGCFGICFMCLLLFGFTVCSFMVLVGLIHCD